MGIIERLLFIDNPDATALASEILAVCELMIIPAFLLALSWEFLSSQMNFKGVLTKLLLAMIALKFFIPLHTAAVELSLDFSDEILTKYSNEKSFEASYNRVIEENDDKGFFYTVLFNVTGATNLISGMVLNFISYFFLFLVKYVFSIIYYLTLILFGVSAVISFLPMSDKALMGHFRASLWCVLMPVVVSFILILIGNSDMVSFTGNDLDQNLAASGFKFISLLMTSACLLISPIITMKLIDGSGVHVATEAIGKAATYATFSSSFQTLQKQFQGGKQLAVRGVQKARGFKERITRIKPMSPAQNLMLGRSNQPQKSVGVKNSPSYRRRS